ncbi:MAG: class I SAM-dependent methyltransferase [Thermodesulfobacteriota bacterium]
MGYLREKYTKEYFLNATKDGFPLPYGAAGISDFHSGSIREIDKDILARLDFRSKRVLDIGFGRGEALKYAAEHGATEVIGVDFSEDAVSIAADFLRRHNVVAQLYCADAVSLMQEWATTKTNSPLDIAIMLDCVEHIPRQELSILLKALRRLMAPRGIIAVNTPVYSVDNDVIMEGLKLTARDSSDTNEATAGMHCNRCSRGSLQVYMSELGFTPISGHLFACSLSVSRWLWGSRRARRKAARLGYPLLLERALMPELFTDCRVSWRAYVQLLLPAWLLRPLRVCVRAVRRLAS